MTLSPGFTAMLLGGIGGGYRLREIGEKWGGLQYSSASGRVYAVSRKLMKGRVFLEGVEEIEQTPSKTTSIDSTLFPHGYVKPAG